MIERVLIAEDHEISSIALQRTMESIHIPHVDYVFYCDDALSKIKTAKALKNAYDLLITDLYFDEDGQAQKITCGTELIEAARIIQPELKVLVFSAESKATVLDTLFNKYEIDGYVRKARNDSKELQQAIQQLSQNRRYLPRHVTQLIKQKNSHEFSEFDITIISLLANGTALKNIPDCLQQKGIRPSGLSSVEKRLNLIKTLLGFTKNEQLVAFCKDMGII
jgi:two-component system, NarL family, captular synthesis response regulator RcsB